jgi:hypothetical protein
LCCPTIWRIARHFGEAPKSGPIRHTIDPS